jgi:hypothetical protein
MQRRVVEIGQLKLARIGDRIAFVDAEAECRRQDEPKTEKNNDQP